jgi:lipopolysaccharide/colanic/teichoic acid biosynthesis glycosyltransferase
MTRFLDILIAGIGLLVLSPVLLIVALAIVIDNPGPVFYRQVRVGRYGRDFRILKFRSMRIGADKMSLITVGDRDPRVTRVGYYIRRYKLDELPQLWNVLTGDMSLVGPRPEVRKYVDLYTEEQKRVLSVRPGITDYASIEYVDENRLLAESKDPDKTYIEEIMPQKIALNMRYINHPTVGEYLRILFLTAKAILR